MRGSAAGMPGKQGGVRSGLRRLRGQGGETLAETLVSMLIISLAMFMLAGAVVASARLNARMEDDDGQQVVQCTMDPSNADSSGSGTVTVGGASAPVTLYTENGYTYYTLSATGP